MRRRTIYRWVFYSLASLGFFLLQNIVLNRLVLWGVHPFLPPALVSIAAAFESRREGFIFACALGLLYDFIFPGVIPCFYLMTFAVSALLASLISRRLVVPGLVCSLLCAAVATLLGNLLYGLLFSYSHAVSFSTVAMLTIRELALSFPVFFLVHFVFQKIHKTFQRD